MPTLCEPSRAHERGFTLLELLIALTLFGLLMTVLLGGLRLGTRVWEASGERLEEQGEILTLQGFLRQRLEEAWPVEEAYRSDEAEPLFDGEADRLRLVSSMPASLGEGLFLIELSLLRTDRGGSDRDLLLRWRPWPATQTVEPGERVLLADVAGMAIAYFGSDGRERPGGWHDRWQYRDDLPELVRITFTFPDGDPRNFPPLLVSPMVDQWYDAGN